MPFRGIRGDRTKEIKWVENEDGCWICTSHAIGNNGYPVIGRNKKFMHLHRYLYEQSNGEIDNPDVVVRHTCNNRKCINPKHWKLGSRKDNSNDRDNAGRTAKGEKSGQCKLTDEQVEAIRKDPRSTRNIGKDYGISNGYVSRLKKYAYRKG